MPPGGITLPDVLTESDLFMNLDTSLLLPQPLNLEPEGKRPESSMDFMSQLLPGSSTQRYASQEPARLEDHTLVDLDLGEDDTPLGGHDFSIEVGRDAPAPRPVGEDLFSEDGKFNDVDLPLDLGEDDAPLDKMDLGEDGPHDNLDNFLQQQDEMDVSGDGEQAAPVSKEPAQSVDEEGRSSRGSSPLSEHRSDIIEAGDQTYDETVTRQEEQEEQEDVAAQQNQRVKRRKLIEADKDTVLHNHEIKQQQADRSRILKPVSFLPRDPVLLTLMDMQKNGDFVSNVMGEGRSRGWAPELRGMLSIEAVRKSGELKRKRDSGISDMDIEAANVPALELGEEEGFVPVDEGVGMDTTLNARSEIEFPGDEEDRARSPHQSDDEGMGQPLDNIDDTIVHPADSGPVSAGTKHAVHILRERFGGDAAAENLSQQKKASVLFQDLLPERETSKADATKMFFEVLVLATKDAVKVEQNTDTIGAPLRIRGKRALWGSWAETQAEGEIANQSTQVTV